MYSTALKLHMLVLVIKPTPPSLPLSILSCLAVGLVSLPYTWTHATTRHASESLQMHANLRWHVTNLLAVILSLFGILYTRLWPGIGLVMEITEVCTGQTEELDS